MSRQSFNPHSRWDRHIPQESGSNRTGSLNEKIKVLAWFEGAKIYPRLFSWNNKRYRIRRINYSWQERQGAILISYFSVDTGSDLYQISFNNIAFSWQLDKII